MLQKLRMKRSTANIPVVICTTAFRLAEDIQAYLAEHSIQVVKKPFNIEDLVSAVKRALEYAEDGSVPLANV
jgi:CheY-like chemotaxis protein